MNRESPLKVVIVDDDDKLRDSYVDIISGSDGAVCIGAFSDCRSALDALEDLQPDVILMDIGLPGMSGIEGVARIKPHYPSVDILMLTIYDDDEKVFQSIQAGASGYLLKTCTADELLVAIRGIKTGAPMTATIARRVLNYVRAAAPTPAEKVELTPRELEILQLVVDGCSDKVIASRLFISPHTVNSHLKHIYEKLHVHSKPEAVSKALRGRLV